MNHHKKADIKNNNISLGRHSDTILFTLNKTENEEKFYEKNMYNKNK